MKHRLLAFFVVAVLLSAPTSFAVQTSATVADVIKMWESKMSADNIVAFIERVGVYAPLSEEDIAQMEDAGLPARLIVEVDRSFSRMAGDDEQWRTKSSDAERRVRAARPLVYRAPYYSPYYSPYYRSYYTPWHTDFGFTFGHGGSGHRRFGRGGIVGHGGGRHGGGNHGR